MGELPAEAKALRARINSELKREVAFLGTDFENTQRFTSGSLSLDVALGGGFPANKWVEVVGHESAGKTAMVYKTLAANMALDPDYSCFWLAAEHYDYDQAKALGVDNSRVIVSPVQEMELGLTLLLEAVESRAVTCIVLDSYPALIADEENEKGMDDFVVAIGARLMSKFVKKAGPASQRNPLGNDPAFHGFIINQYREKVGAYSPNAFSKPQDTPGGRAKNYFFYARIEARRDEYITEKRPGFSQPVKVGQRIRYTTIKNKSSAPQQRAYVDFYFRGAPFLGFRRGDYDLGQEYVEQGIVFNIVRKNGSWLEYGTEKWQGKAKMIEAVRADPHLADALRRDVLEVVADPENADSITEEAYESAREGSHKVKRSDRSLEAV